MISDENKNEVHNKQPKASITNTKKKSLTDVIGILGPIPKEIQEQLEGKTFEQIKEEGITRYMREIKKPSDPRD